MINNDTQLNDKELLRNLFKIKKSDLFLALVLFECLQNFTNFLFLLFLFFCNIFKLNTKLCILFFYSYCYYFKSFIAFNSKNLLSYLESYLILEIIWLKIWKIWKGGRFLILWIFPEGGPCVWYSFFHFITHFPPFNPTIFAYLRTLLGNGTIFSLSKEDYYSYVNELLHSNEISIFE